MEKYKILINKITLKKIENYLTLIKKKSFLPGNRLKNSLQNIDIYNISPIQFAEILFNTKIPQVYAESAVNGDGSDWNKIELSILGDISIALPVITFDNALHSLPQIHSNPFQSILVFIPGALLENMKGEKPADWDELVQNEKINLNGMFELYERRFLAPFTYINLISKLINQQAIITIPGLGCGQFSGKFRGSMGMYLKTILIAFLKKYINFFENIKVIYYDPFDECENDRIEIQHLSFLTRPLRKGNKDKGQLCQVVDYQDQNDNFEKLKLFSIVAWDHVSWPGNDFYIGSRTTDDGVKAAATNLMEIITGIKGYYNEKKYRYLPPKQYKNWKEVVLKNKIKFNVTNNIFLYPKN